MWKLIDLTLLTNTGAPDFKNMVQSKALGDIIQKSRDMIIQQNYPQMRTGTVDVNEDFDVPDLNAREAWIKADPSNVGIVKLNLRDAEPVKTYARLQAAQLTRLLFSDWDNIEVKGTVGDKIHYLQEVVDSGN